VNKSNAEYTKDKSNDEDNEDSHSAKEEQITEDSESVKTPPVKKRGRPKKIVRANDSKSSSVKRRVSPRNRNDELKKKTIVLFNAMDILNGDRKKCLDEMGFGSMIEMGIHELPGKLGFYVIDNLDTEANVLSLTDNSIVVTSQSVQDILGIPMGGCLESLEPRSPDDPFIKEWLSQFGDKNENTYGWMFIRVFRTKKS
nr:hypothetical protein [Tanacetum cinerariifolium]